MEGKRFSSGAFVFSRAQGLVARRPEDLRPLATRHGFGPGIVPEYAGDRAAIGRAIQHTSTRVVSETYLLRPIRRTQTEVVYGIVLERKDGADHLDHEHEATVTWRSEPYPEYVEGDHMIAKRVHLKYAELRGKIVADDWTAVITRELERLGSVPFREDGRVYWVPPQSLDEVRRLSAFIAEVGVALVVAEVEKQSAGLVTEVVGESVADQVHKLKLEVEAFDGTQKPTTYARRLEEYQALRGKCILYRDALGIGTDEAEKALAELESKVEAMLDLRKNTVVHRNGKAPESKAASLKFAGADFFLSESTEPGVMTFVSGDGKAQSAVAMLASMGLAGAWQKAGATEVCIQNSGPKGAEVSVKLKLPLGVDLNSLSPGLRAMGIEINA